MKRWVTLVGYLEGLSFLVLMFYAMPLKYIAGEPEMVTLFGSLHGVIAAVGPAGPFLFEGMLSGGEYDL